MLGRFPVFRVESLEAMPDAWLSLEAMPDAWFSVCFVALCGFKLAPVVFRHLGPSKTGPPVSNTLCTVRSLGSFRAAAVHGKS